MSGSRFSTNSQTNEGMELSKYKKDFKRLTLREKRDHQGQILKELLTLSGNGKRLSEMLGIPFSTVQGWIQRKRISKAGAVLISQHPTFKDNYPTQEILGDF